MAQFDSLQTRTIGISFEKSHADAARDGNKRSACFVRKVHALKAQQGINRRTIYPITP